MSLARVTVLAIALALSMGSSAIARPADPDANVGSTRTLYLSLIRQARVDGKARAALAYLDDFARHYPDDREARILRVNCLLDLGQIDQAQAAATQIPASDRSGEAMAVRGHVLAAQDRWGEAVTAYIAAQAASPADPLIGNALGYAQLRTGQAEQAVETLKRALDLAPDIAQGHDVVRNNLALALTAAGRIDEAAALVARVRDSSERLRLGNRLAAEAARLPAPRRASEAIVQ